MEEELKALKTMFGTAEPLKVLFGSIEPLRATFAQMERIVIPIEQINEATPCRSLEVLNHVRR